MLDQHVSETELGKGKAAVTRILRNNKGTMSLKDLVGALSEEGVQTKIPSIIGLRDQKVLKFVHGSVTEVVLI